MKVVTRFAPSPTGFLHIGGVRTAMYNWLFAKRHGGQFLLRIEDTDRERHVESAIEALQNDLLWCGLKWDGAPVIQSTRITRHQEVAAALVESGRAYYCFCNEEETEALRAQAMKDGKATRSPWRDQNRLPQNGESAVVRLKMADEGQTILHDQVAGEVTIANDQIDDMVLLRTDGTPTFVLSCAVDDYDMGVTHVIRGNEHLNNAFRQYHIIQAMGWQAPIYGHLPVILNDQGGKLSKRDGHAGIQDYQKEGYLPDAIFNYLLRLGWSHGDDEIISRDQAIEWFGLDHVMKSPAKFDFVKLTNLNAHYLREENDEALLDLAKPFLTSAISAKSEAQILALIPELKQRAKTLKELANSFAFIAAERPLALDEEGATMLTDADNRKRLGLAKDFLAGMDDWQKDMIKEKLPAWIKEQGFKMPEIMKPLRSATTGSPSSPADLYSVLAILGKDEILGRIEDVIR